MNSISRKAAGNVAEFSLEKKAKTAVSRQET
jgi:hypothetical protein